MAGELSLDVYERGAVALIEYACGGAAGRDKDDPVYTEVTEGRDRGEARARYSSCGDLWHWLMKRLDVEEKWVNRTDDGKHGPFVYGRNVSHLAGCPLAFTPGADWKPAPGDCVVVWDRPDTQDAHIMAWIGPDPAKPGHYRTGNYGAGGMNAANSPGARLASKELSWNGSKWRYGARTVQRSIRLADVIKLSHGNVDLTGSPNTLEDLMDQTSGEDADALTGHLVTPSG